MLPSIWIELYRLAATGLLGLGLAVGAPSASDPNALASTVVPNGQTLIVSADDSSASASVSSTDESIEANESDVAAADLVNAPDGPAVAGSTLAVRPAAPLAWSAKVSPAFVAEVRAMCLDLGCQPNDLMAAMAFESVETFSPSVRNPYSGAVGLIQFMDDTARNLGTSSDALAAMSAEDQLKYVRAYFAPFKGHLSTLGDVYMAILWPSAVGRADSYPLFVEGTVQYAQNDHLDVDGDGTITKREASSLVAAKLAKGSQPRYAVGASAAQGVGAEG